MVDERFAEYILGELFWEMEQADLTLTEVEQITKDSVNVLSYSNNLLQFQANGVTFEALLSWRPDVAPIITRK